MSAPKITPALLSVINDWQGFTAETYIDSLRQITRWVVRHHNEIDEEDDNTIFEVVGNLMDLACELRAFTADVDEFTPDI